MSVYQKKVKAILKDIGNEAADGAEKHFDRARDAISDWIKEADKKIPMGGEKLAKVVREVSDAGAKVFKEGRKAVEDAIDSAEKNLHVVAKKTNKAIRSKAPTKRTPAVKKLVPRKTSQPVKKVESTPSGNGSDQ
jgi:CHASE3 domain sensor protein